MEEKLIYGHCCIDNDCINKKGLDWSMCESCICGVAIYQKCVDISNYVIDEKLCCCD